MSIETMWLNPVSNTPLHDKLSAFKFIVLEQLNLYKIK